MKDFITNDKLERELRGISRNNLYNFYKNHPRFMLVKEGSDRSLGTFFDVRCSETGGKCVFGNFRTLDSEIDGWYNNSGILVLYHNLSYYFFRTEAENFTIDLSVLDDI